MKSLQFLKDPLTNQLGKLLYTEDIFEVFSVGIIRGFAKKMLSRGVPEDIFGGIPERVLVKRSEETLRRNSRRIYGRIPFTIPGKTPGEISFQTHGEIPKRLLGGSKIVT